ncbi:MAG: C45 family autoproteolytic acyltransferase/hydrolase [Candidatus Binatia bacterium]
MVLTAAVVATTLFACLPLGCGDSDSTQPQGFREERQGWIYAQIAGSPHERGSQYGSLLASEIDDFVTTVKAYVQHYTDKDWTFFRQTAETLFLPKMEPEYVQEMEGIADGLRSKGYNYDDIDILALNGFAEIAEYYLPSIGEVSRIPGFPYGRSSIDFPYTSPIAGVFHGRGGPSMHCSAVIATGDWTRDRNIVLAHNSWNDYVLGERWNVILDIAPASGNRILMQTAPGLIHSFTDFNVSSAGIVVSETTIGLFRGFDTNGIPELMRARKAVQYSNSIDDFVKIMMTGNNGGYANSWLVGDIDTGEIAKLELGLIHVALYRTKNGFYDGENYVDDSSMIRDECGPTLWITSNDWPFQLTDANCVTARRMRWYALMSEYKGQVDAELGKSFMADQYEQALGKVNPGGFVLMARMEVTDRPEIPGVPAPRPMGANDAKVITADLARQMSFWARIGHPDGSPFTWGPFMEAHPEFQWQQPYLKDLQSNDWALFSSSASQPSVGIPMSRRSRFDSPATAVAPTGYRVENVETAGQEVKVHYVRTE